MGRQAGYKGTAFFYIRFAHSKKSSGYFGIFLRQIIKPKLATITYLYRSLFRYPRTVRYKRGFHTIGHYHASLLPHYAADACKQAIKVLLFSTFALLIQKKAVPLHRNKYMSFSLQHITTLIPHFSIGMVGLDTPLQQWAQQMPTLFALLRKD